LKRVENEGYNNNYNGIPFCIIFRCCLWCNLCHQNNLQGNNNVLDSILVQGTTSGSSEDQNISVEITKNTVVLYKQGNTLENASSNDLVPGQVIGIKFSGPLLQTYPPQTNASQIIILDNQG
jgi:hypothetical protein